MGVDAGADGRGAQVDLMKVHQRLTHAELILFDHYGVGAEFLSQSHRDRILQLSPADFHYTFEPPRQTHPRVRAGGLRNSRLDVGRTLVPPRRSHKRSLRLQGTLELTPLTAHYMRSAFARPRV